MDGDSGDPQGAFPSRVTPAQLGVHTRRVSVPPDGGLPSVVESRPAPQPRTDSERDADVHAFLIADVRGWTAFTQERGDEDAARLAGRFADVARSVVEAHRGRVLELRGDEALVIFGSPRSAIRGAVALQRRFVEETTADPSLPLTVGIGLDAGEAVAVEGGYRGGALNVAARLCSLARAGEVLASREIVAPRQTGRRRPFHRAWAGGAEGPRPADPRRRNPF